MVQKAFGRAHVFKDRLRLTYIRDKTYSDWLNVPSRYKILTRCFLDIMRFLKRVKKKIQVYRAIWNSWNYWWYRSWVCLISLIFNCSSNFPFLNAVIICSWQPTWALLLLRLNRCSWYLWSSYFLCLQGIIVFEVHYVVRFCGTSSNKVVYLGDWGGSASLVFLQSQGLCYLLSLYFRERKTIWV